MDDERNLIDRVVAGDEAAAAELFAAYQRLVRFVLWKLRVPAEDIDDVSQDVWMDVWRQLRNEKFRQDSRFGTWLRPIVAGKAVDAARRRASRGAELTVSMNAPALAYDRQLAVPSDQHIRVLAEDALACLPERLQLVFRMHYREQLPPRDVAAALGLSMPRTYALIAEARDLFAEVVQHREKTPRPKRPSGGTHGVRIDGALPKPSAE